MLIKAIAVLLVVFGVFDGLWLGLVARQFYQKYIGFLLAKDPNWGAAGLFYLLYMVGVLVFVVWPALKGNWGLVQIGLMGVLFGLVSYGTYDLTNWATIRDWPMIVVVVDMVWGAFFTGSASVISVWILRLWK